MTSALDFRSLVSFTCGQKVLLLLRKQNPTQFFKPKMFWPLLSLALETQGDKQKYIGGASGQASQAVALGTKAANVHQGNDSNSQFFQ